MSRLIGGDVNSKNALNRNRIRLTRISSRSNSHDIENKTKGGKIVPGMLIELENGGVFSFICTIQFIPRLSFRFTSFCTLASVFASEARYFFREWALLSSSLFFHSFDFVIFILIRGTRECKNLNFNRKVKWRGKRSRGLITLRVRRRLVLACTYSLISNIGTGTAGVW